MPQIPPSDRALASSEGGICAILIGMFVDAAAGVDILICEI
jgi:hypothetical protein